MKSMADSVGFDLVATATASATAKATTTTTTTAPFEWKDSPADTIPVFYNLYIQNASHHDRVKRIVEEQFNELLLIHKPVYVSNIGVPLDFNDAEGGILRDGPLNTTENPVELLGGVHGSASELVTLRHLWDYCRDPRHRHRKVAYLHRKGSFHDTPENRNLRRFITAGTLSEACSSSMPMPSEDGGDEDEDEDGGGTTFCNVCASRFSPLPHPHTSGNMWVARCSYVWELIDPGGFGDAMDALDYAERPSLTDPCDGKGRYAAEHRILSHPTARPCDLYKSGTFTWNHERIPAVDRFRKETVLAAFPRFGLEAYLKPKICPLRSTLEFRIYEYRELYDRDPPPDWWGYVFFPKDEEFVLFPHRGKKWYELPPSVRMEAVRLGYIPQTWNNFHWHR